MFVDVFVFALAPVGPDISIKFVFVLVSFGPDITFKTSLTQFSQN